GFLSDHVCILDPLSSPYGDASGNENFVEYASIEDHHLPNPHIAQTISVQPLRQRNNLWRYAQKLHVL
ncbi:hypothetical protein PISMIDRAFT_677808, partial [Pisolithus microcarpus 441]